MTAGHYQLLLLFIFLTKVLGDLKADSRTATAFFFFLYRVGVHVCA